MPRLLKNCTKQWSCPRESEKTLCRPDSSLDIDTNKYRHPGNSPASSPIGEEFIGRSEEETTLNISASSRYVSGEIEVKSNYFLLLQMWVFSFSTFEKTVLSLKIWILLVCELHIHAPCKNFGQTFRSISLLVFVVDIYAGCTANVQFWLLSSCETFC